MFAYYYFLIFSVLAIGYGVAKEQNVTVKGNTICGNRYIAGAIVQLWEKDTFDPDDKLAEVTTAPINGRFEIFGSTTEITAIEPYIVIIHNCAVRDPQSCLRRTYFPVHQRHIGKVYDTSLMQLKFRQFKDIETCQ